jgi:type I restriction enzyme S subunit
MSEIKNLPKDWKWVKLGDVCEKMSNGANVKQVDDKIGFPISRIETIWNETIDLSRVKYIQEDDAAFVEKYSLKKGDILFSHINSDIHLGKTAIFKNQTKILIHGINLLVIRLNNDVLANFFNYQFKYKRRKGEFIQIAQKSVNQSSINQPKLKNIDFVLPPKPVQQAIVSKIEELFSELDKGIENLRLVQQQLRTYRQAVLKWAYEGKLTNENVKDNELPKEWRWVKMGDLIEKPKYGSSKKCEYEIKGLGVLRIPNIVRGVVDSTDLKFAKFTQQEIEAYSLKEGDILTIRSNGSVDIVGKCALITKKDEGFLYAGYLIRLRPIPKVVLSKYLINILSSGNLRNQIEDKSKSTSGINNINSEELAGLRISLPSMEEQHAVVQEIESRLSVADKMEESITQSLQQAEALRQSILKRAFEGSLLIHK